MASPNVWGGIGASATSAASVTSAQIAYRALRLLGVLRPGAAASPEYLSDCHDALNSLVDTWSLDRMMVYAVSRERFTLTPGQSAYTIGSGGDFLTSRPPQMDRVSVLVPVGTATITSATAPVVTTAGSLVWNEATQTWDAITGTWDTSAGSGDTGGSGTSGVTWDASTGTWDATPGTWDGSAGSGSSSGGSSSGGGTTQVTITNYSEYPLSNLNYDQWRMVPYKGDSSMYPSSFYYEPSYPLGVVNIWPTPSQAYPVLLGTWQQINFFDTLDTPYSLPPGYAEALVYGLAAQIAPMFAIVAKIPAPHIASIEDKALKLKAGIQSVNAPAPVMAVDSAFGGSRGFYDITTNR